jgi:hypothetical protein
LLDKGFLLLSSEQLGNNVSWIEKRNEAVVYLWKHSACVSFLLL